MIKRFFMSIALIVSIFGGKLIATTIPPDAKNIVTFIFLPDSSGKPTAIGTAFFVAVRNEANPKILHGYLVTAKHVLLDKEKRFYPSVFIRLNKKDGGAGWVEIPLQGKNSVPIYTHQDSTVDIAVLPMLPDTDIFDFKVLPEEYLTTKEVFKKVNIREGDEIFFTGLFWHFLGSEKNYPIVRFGRVALVTDEKIPWEDKMLDLYFIEAQAFGGNSGSPVFFYLGITREPGSLMVGSSRFLLAGIMKGFFREATQIGIVETSKVPVSLENAGIAAVIPCYLLYEILFSSELKQARKKKE